MPDKSTKAVKDLIAGWRCNVCLNNAVVMPAADWQNQYHRVPRQFYNMKGSMEIRYAWNFVDDVLFSEP